MFVKKVTTEVSPFLSHAKDLASIRHNHICLFSDKKKLGFMIATLTTFISNLFDNNEKLLNIQNYLFKTYSF